MTFVACATTELRRAAHRVAWEARLARRVGWIIATDLPVPETAAIAAGEPANRLAAQETAPVSLLLPTFILFLGVDNVLSVQTEHAWSRRRDGANPDAEHPATRGDVDGATDHGIEQFVVHVNPFPGTRHTSE